MQVIETTDEMQKYSESLRLKGEKIAFVPTMGNLHEGHLTLIRKSHEHADVVVASIFVNPMQFDKADDLAKYPRRLEQDLAKMEKEHVDWVLTPTAEMMYP